jgi:hypothetical protein
MNFYDGCSATISLEARQRLFAELEPRGGRVKYGPSSEQGALPSSRSDPLV